jgi:DNA primase
MIPKAFIDSVIRKTDLTGLISGYVELSATGQSYTGACPFDGRGKLKFTVSPDKQIWKCFTCGKGGNAVGFIMEIEKLPFPKAVGLLAEKLGLEVLEEEE